MAVAKTIRIDSRAVSACKLSDAVRKGTYLYSDFKRQWSLSALNGYGTPTVTAAEVNEFRDGLYAGTYYRLAGDATILGPVFDQTVGKLDISGDQTTLEGAEFVPGRVSLLNPFGITVNTPTVKTAVRTMHRLSGSPVTAANVAHFMVGFRKEQAYTADYNDYTDLCALDLAAGTVNLVTILNNATTVVTSTTLTVADAVAADFCIDVEPNGRAHFYKSGKELGVGLPSSGAALPRFTFDAGDHLVPFYLFNHATAAAKFYLNEGEMGPRQELNQFPR
jgi:hypothetical protein